MSELTKSPVELQIDQLAACNVGGRIEAAIYNIVNMRPGSARLILEELLCFIQQRDLPRDLPGEEDEISRGIGQGESTPFDNPIKGTGHEVLR